MKKTIIFCLVTLMIISACAGCGTKVGNNTVALYFLNADGSAMAEETAQVPDGAVDKLTFALEKLLEGPQDPMHKKALPDGVKYNSITLEDGVATIDLSPEFNIGTDVEQLWSRYTLINTACSVRGVEKALILVDGETITSLSTGQPLVAMGKEDIITDHSQVSSDKVSVVLYFSDSNAMYLVPETRRISVKEGEKMSKVIVQQLLKGPQDKSLLQTLPADISVLSTETKDGICFVNLSADFVTKASGGTTGETLAVYSIVNSLCELKDVNKVQILSEGKKIEEFGHIDLSEPFGKNNSLVEKSDED